ncbi:hypothetical protein C789_3291 [Microcystis aeruginosa FACHB-905 = DIANCHI905]|uniref:Genome sequencing data, contig C317 n=1 Tax=Microcystis aeruginosa (strain PCC 7806) TaxID=267872 RepID=A8YID7_MICA7|nr:hypothetical protein C789_3291 [Microcystis aeruginosa FACHB-905 = DIANCHI905]CAO90038.1 unnamed protein product [Microcystis aeruginosa PCC 7806]
MQFEWNKNKAVNNLSKHGVSFEEAKTVWLFSTLCDNFCLWNREMLIG